MLKTKLLTFLLLTILGLIPAPIALAKEPIAPAQESIIVAKQTDPRTLILKKYFARYNSPLEAHAQDFIEAADTYGVDWKLVPAISGVESTFGKAIPGGYNGWGWGVYGDQALGFSSWRDGIFTVTKGLKEDYMSRGLLTPYQLNTRYAASPTWGWRVDFFMKDINSFAIANGYNAQTDLALDQINGSQTMKTAHVSANLTVRETNLAFLYQ